MDIEKYISSGVLELYLTGTLTEEENWEVYQNALDHPRIKEEIVSIEAAIFELSRSVSPKISRKKGFDDLKNRIGQGESVQSSEKTINWNVYGTVAAAVLLVVGLLLSLNKISQLKSNINSIDQQNQVLQFQMVEIEDSLAKSKELLTTLRNENTLVIPLIGQEVSPNSMAKVYWNKEQQKLFIDAQGLPKPPDGFIYQVWSLQLNPFTPTSLGILDGFLIDENEVFALENLNITETEAFGITLEPEGGSETTTLGQLYVLGASSS